MKKQKFNKRVSAHLIEYAASPTLRTEYKRAGATP
jgi:hypothetical protein